MPAGVGAFLFSVLRYICLFAKNALDFRVNFGYTYETEDICFQKKQRGSDTDYANPLGPIHLSEAPTTA